MPPPHDDDATRIGRTSTSRMLTMNGGESDAAPPAEPRVALEPGHVLGSYRIVRLLGKGGMGEVYEAEQVETGRRVALKVLGRALGGAPAVARFLREGRLAAAVSHPNSVYVYGSHEIDGVPMIAMELVDGGTLQETIDGHGAMAPAAAVDAILQVIAGLEAADAAGVLHRDIKPSNCFVDAGGTVKVGDFGLSMSMMAAEAQQTQLTMLGTFLGTPAYASPEQVSGGELDVRSDIYSVGATLYFLLTGRTPFGNAGVMQVFAAILREDPASPRTHAPAIPEKLADVVLRCLRKNPAARYASYAELRDALVPFSSRVAEAASLRLRLLAWLIDAAVLFPVNLLTTFLTRADASTTPGGSTASVTSLGGTLVVSAIACLYFGIAEGIWGATVGKRVCRLAVVGREQTAPGVFLASLRVVTFTAVSSIPTFMLYALYGVRPVVAIGRMAAIFGPATLATFALVWATARRRNGWRGLHEWASGTRVVRTAAAAQQTTAARAEIPSATPLDGRIRQYLLRARYWTDGPRELIAAEDEMLRRPVWILRDAPDTPPPTIARQNVARTTRLRVLASIRAGDEAYDVFEAIDGERLPAGSPWSSVRRWLAGLVDELASAIDDGTIPGPLTLNHVWVTSTGGVRLLDFPGPVRVEASPIAVRDVASLQSFLAAVASAALAPGTLLPMSARIWLDRLARGAFTTIDELRSSLHQAMDALSDVTRARRAASIAMAAAPALVLVVGSVVPAIGVYRVASNPTLDSLDRSLRRLDSMDRATAPSAQTIAEREAFRIYVGHQFSDAIGNPSTWFLDRTLSIRRPVAERARQAALAADTRTVQRATVDAASVVDDLARAAARRPSLLLTMASVPVVAICVGGGFAGVFGIILSLVFGAPAALRLLGLTLATTGGETVSRARVAFRGAIAWGPMIAGGMALPISRAFPGHPLLPGWLGAVAILITAAGMAIMWRTPERGVQDRIAGTVVVPA